MRLICGAILVTGFALSGAVGAHATPGSGITAETLAQARIPADLLPGVAGTEAVVRRRTGPRLRRSGTVTATPHRRSGRST